MLRIGIAGLGFMGRMHYKCYKAIKGAEVAAICDVNPNIEEDTKRAGIWMRSRLRCPHIYTQIIL